MFRSGTDTGVFDGPSLFRVLLLKKFEIVPGRGDLLAMQDAFIAGENIGAELLEPSSADTGSRGHGDVLRKARNDFASLNIDAFVVCMSWITGDLFQKISSCIGRCFRGEVANETLTTAPDALKSFTFPERVALTVAGVEFTILLKVNAKQAGVIVGPIEATVLEACNRVCFAIFSAMKVADAATIVFAEPFEEPLKMGFDERAPRGDLSIVIGESDEAAGVMELRLMVETERPLFGALEPAANALTAWHGNGQVAVSRFFTERKLSLAGFCGQLRPEPVEREVAWHVITECRHASENPGGSCCGYGRPYC